ncbi:hypothetical protein J2S74_004782 [Evansella vedderi]|uniref:Transporter n=1 Tax=Evansella vedderi TaxID=38282 RepID=A0ABU0A1H0_9BACI|nr:hypothetical protein [Evansella vedderi]MDQ0257324.1 hypothetical protein [Evansella vedderi]
MDSDVGKHLVFSGAYGIWNLSRGEKTLYTQGPFHGLMNYLFPQPTIGQPPIFGGWGPGFPGIGGLFPGGTGQMPPGPPPIAGPGGQAGPPPGPPPVTTPQQQLGGIGTLAVDPGSLYGCMNRYTYMILEDGRAFWFWPTFIGRTSVAGYRWHRRQQRWIYTGFDTRLINWFQCY